jgi:hypothetical protein
MYPTPEQDAEIDAQIAEEERLIDEARARMAARGKPLQLKDWGA